MISLNLNKIRAVLYRVEPLFKYIPFILLVGCFIQVFTYEYDQLSVFKRTMGIVYQTNGFGLLMLTQFLYYLSVKKTCIYPVITTIGLMVLCFINIIILSVLNIKILYYDIPEKEMQDIMISGDKIGVIYDSWVILITLAISSFYFAKEEIFNKTKYNEK